jgi:hypothetical protein
MSVVTVMMKYTELNPEDTDYYTFCYKIVLFSSTKIDQMLILLHL